MHTNVLAVNPGGTSTKIGYFSDNKLVFKKTIEHSGKRLEKFSHVNEQLGMRTKEILLELETRNIDIVNISGVVGRGGVLPPLQAGGYDVNSVMIDFLLHHAKLEHAANLGAIIADSIARLCSPSSKAFIYDGETLDQLCDLARFSGVAAIQRESLGHILNSRAVARNIAGQLNRPYEELNFIVAHMGGGTTLSSHEKGRVIDVIADDEGPFSVERSGSLALKHVIRLCYEKSKAEIQQILRVNGGLKSYLGTNDCRIIEEKIQNGDTSARQVYEAFAYQVAKAIGQMAVPLEGKVDGIVLTGGVAHSDMITAWIQQRVSFIAPVFIVPGEFELEALAGGAWRILTGKEDAHTFSFE